MPIGVPRVLFISPDGELSWVDIYNLIYRERLFFLGGTVDGELSNQLISLMIYLSLETDNKDMYMFINSPGGWVISGMAIYDTMQSLSPDVQTICMGFAASIASFILVGGAITKRIAFPHARVMIHQPASSLYMTQTGEFVVEAEELLKLRETITGVYAQRTGKPIWVVSEDMERDAFMSATEAQAHGIVDHVAVQKQK
uniref:ATP-dependent Clp protease proteolytic subunit n=1 Tax=Sieruela rutidosperma TaxID=190803 RepID=UPI002E7A9E99|nr:ATP-dependent Clp protease proteolytic subunit [Sieruela rutidosperma]WPW43002.1 ATP-dependent Clp protease proteolytic subunit [Sieruela rutidosperma]